MKSLLLAFALLFSLVYASRASADECGGTLTHTQPMVSSSGERVGTLYLYWNSSNGNNCAVLNHSGRTWGWGLWAKVRLYDCTGGPCVLKNSAEGADPYRVGPIRVYGRGRCILADGLMYLPGEHAWTTTGNKGCFLF